MTSVSIQPKNTTNKTTDAKSSESNASIDKYSLFKLDKDRDDFTQRLIEFHRHKNVNTPLISWPTLNGRSIDLYKLYMRVISLGGWETVCEKDKWNDIGAYLDKSNLSACTNGSHALRLIYIRYLSLFEKFNQSLMSSGVYSMPTLLNDSVMFNSALNTFNASSILAPNAASFLSNSSLINSNSKSMLDDKVDDISLISKRKFSYLIDSTSMNYNYNQHYSLNADPSTISSKLIYNPYEKLEISLISGLPNEIDFVFNTILLLSSDEYHSFRIYSSPRLLDLMLAHIGFFGSNEDNDIVKSNYRNLYDNVWHKVSDKNMSKRNYVKFWHNAIQPPVAIDNQDEYDEDDEFGFPNPNKLINNLLPKLYNKYLKTLPPQELLNLQETINDNNESKLVDNNKSVEFRRIEQIMVILNNLSFEDNNADFMANKSVTLFEFLIMCVYCTGSDVELKKHALDILVNLSRKMKLKSMNDNQQRLLLMSICHLIVGHSVSRGSINPDSSDDIREHYDEQSQDRLDVLRGLEILTKLCSQQIDPQIGSIDYANEAILSQYYLNEMTGILFLNKILVRLEQLLTVQDVFILIHTLECLYNMSQFNEAICNLIVSYSSGLTATPKIVSMLVNFLTVDMTHFGLNSTQISHTSKQKKSSQMKIYKVCLPNGTILNQNQVTVTNSNIPNGQQAIILNNNQISTVNKISNHSNTNNNSNSNSNHLTSLLQQTLNNQHHLNTTTNNSNTVSALLNNINKTSNNLQQQQINSQRSVQINPEQQAKNVLCNWLRTCFQTDPNSELSKTKLYPYYQQIAKMNNWNVLTIPTFFEILNATFPNLRYNDATNQIQGLKLVVNVKQQLLLKKDELISQADNETNSWLPLPQNNNNIKIKSINNSPIIATSAIVNKTIEEQDNKNNVNILPVNKIPLPLPNINVLTPSIMPLLTPPTPPPQSGPQTDENLNNNLTNGTININTIKQTTKLLNDTSNVKVESSEQQTIAINDKKYEKKIDIELTKQNSNSEDLVINNIERRIAINNENNLKPSNGVITINENKLTNGNLSEEKVMLTNGNSKHVSLTNGHANHSSVSSSTSASSVSSDDEEDEENKMEDDGQIESFRKRKHDMTDMENKTEDTKIDIKDEEPISDNIKVDKNEIIMVETSKEISPKKQKTTYDEQDKFDKTETLNCTTEPNSQSNNVNSQNNVNNNNVTNISINPTSGISSPPPSSPIPANNQGGDYVCEWNNCKMSFSTAKSISSHVCKYHLLNTETALSQNSSTNINGSLCLWLGCDQIRRQKWALVNHIQERHCNENALKCALMYRQRGLVPVTPNSTNNLGAGVITINYSKDAALLAIQKNQRKSIEEFMSVEEGPVSKSVRLLSALTLRNLARNSDQAKQVIKAHESVLTEMAFDLLESSNVLANCLWHITN